MAETYPLFWRLGSLLSVVALAAILMLFSSLILRDALKDAMNAIETSLQPDTRAAHAESGGVTVAGATQLSRAITTVQDVRQRLESNQTLTLLLESACLVVLLIAGITGHRQDEIDQILAHYRARTADQAAAALELRLAHEAKKSGAT